MAKRAVRSRQVPFDREKHVYKNEAFVELIKDAVRFFNGTPVHPAQQKTHTKSADTLARKK